LAEGRGWWDLTRHHQPHRGGKKKAECGGDEDVARGGGVGFLTGGGGESQADRNKQGEWQIWQCARVQSRGHLAGKKGGKTRVWRCGVQTKMNGANKGGGGGVVWLPGRGGGDIPGRNIKEGYRGSYFHKGLWGMLGLLRPSKTKKKGGIGDNLWTGWSGLESSCHRNRGVDCTHLGGGGGN